VLRTRGRLLLAASAGDPAPAEACFLEALEHARRFDAKTLELRAAASLADLWGRLSRRVEGHRLLADVYGRFTEGFETRDLRDVAAELAELASPMDAARSLAARTST
jgi:predicted ATPase